MRGRLYAVRLRFFYIEIFFFLGKKVSPMGQPNNSDDDPICPHCDRVIVNFLDGEVYRDGETLTEQECPHCKNLFEVEVTVWVSFSYTTQKEGDE